MGDGVNEQQIIQRYLPWLDADTLAFLDRAVAIVAAKNKGRKVVVATLTQRSMRVAETLAAADVIIESVVAKRPFNLYTDFQDEHRLDLENPSLS